MPYYPEHIRSKGDEYYTPISVWENIIEFLPKDKIICDPFNSVGNPTSMLNHANLKSLGLKMSPLVKYDHTTGEGDFFKDDGKEWDVLVSNAPFSIKQKIIKKLVDMDKPFCIIVPTITMSNKYISKLGKHIQIIIPCQRIKYFHADNVTNGRACFPSVYLCYKMNLPDKLIFQ